MKNFGCAILTILALVSCKKQEDGLLIIRDTGYFDPAYRFDRISNGDSLFYLSERYFVLGYKRHKVEFEQAALKLACKRINDSLQVSRYDIDFQDSRMRSTRFKEDTNLSTDFTEQITYFTWHRARPDSITINRHNGKYFVQELNPFDCALVPSPKARRPRKPTGG